MIAYLRNIRNKLSKLKQLQLGGVESYMTLVLLNLPAFFYSNRKFYRARNTVIKNKGLISVKESLDVGFIGLHDVFRKDKTVISCEGKLIVDGGASIGKGSAVFIDKNASLQIGHNTFITGRAIITVTHGVNIGNDCAISWNVTIIDNDYHQLIPRDTSSPVKDKNIRIGNNVWIGCNVTILKGVTISDGAVIAANSVVNKSVTEPNVLIAGNPAVIVRRNINWKR